MNNWKALCTVLLMLFLNADDSAGMSRETMTKLDAALGNWKSITPETLLNPDNADLLQELRRLSKDPRQTAARVPLIKLGDEEVIRSCMEGLRTERPGARNRAVRQLGFSGNPEVIPMLINDLNKHESPAMIRFGDTQIMMPLSMAAASTIKAIILESSVFPQNVKEWAKGLPEVSAGLREEVSAWWETNKAATERGDYQSVVPVKGKPQVATGQSGGAEQP
jgi:hypothetical protein